MSHLYLAFIPIKKDPVGALTKVGYSSEPMSRLGQLQIGTPENLEAHVWKINSPKTMEEFIHKVFADHRIRGEWFKFNIDEFGWLCAMLNSVSLHCECRACEEGFGSTKQVA